MQPANTRILTLSAALFLGAAGTFLLGRDRLPFRAKPTPVFNAPRDQSFARPELEAMRELVAQCEASLARAEETPWLSLLQVRALGPRAAQRDLTNLTSFVASAPNTPAPAPFTADALAGVLLTLAEARKPVTTTNLGVAGSGRATSALEYAARLSTSAALDEAQKHAKPPASGVPAEVPELLRFDVVARNLEGALLSVERLTLDSPGSDIEAAIEAALLVAQVVFHSLARLELKAKPELDARARRSYLKLRALSEQSSPGTPALVQFQRSALLAELSAVVALTNPNADAASGQNLTLDTRQLLAQLGQNPLCDAPPKDEAQVAALSSALRALRGTSFALQRFLTAAP